MHADRSNPSVFKKSGQRHAWLAQIIIYSMSVDGPVRPPVGEDGKPGSSTEKSFLAGSKALDSLDRRVGSFAFIETFINSAGQTNHQR